jgi:uncharacterized protein YyaL (SSP411 family)
VLKAIAPYLGQFDYDVSSSLQADNVYRLVFSNGRERILVAWATGRQRQEQISAVAMDNAALRVLDTQTPEKGMVENGQRWVCDGSHCLAPVKLSEFPKIIRLNPGA